MKNRQGFQEELILKMIFKELLGFKLEQGWWGQGRVREEGVCKGDHGEGGVTYQVKGTTHTKVERCEKYIGMCK